MANKKKEKCPYCGKEFVYLGRHKCSKEPKNKDDVVEIKEIKLDDSTPATALMPAPEKLPVKAPISDKEDVIVGSHNNTIRFISKFFKPGIIKVTNEKEKTVIRDILKNPIGSLDFLDNKDINAIKVILMINTIGEFLNYKDKNLYNFISSAQLKSLEKQEIEIKDLEQKIQKAITITSIFNQLKEKSITLEKKGEDKIIVAGLDRAGKTAILTTFGGQLGIEDLTKLKPTKKVNRRKIETNEISLIVWDFGGQTQYRQDYLKNPGAYFLDVSLFIYVIDVQDYERFDESFLYLKAILDAFKMLEEEPYMLIFIHKFDPDLRSDPDVNLNVEYVKETLREILVDCKIDYEIYLTSIYSVISKEPKFAKYLKEMVSQKDLIADPTLDKVAELGKIIDNALNALIKLSGSVSDQFNAFEMRFETIERKLMAIDFKLQFQGSATGTKQPVETSKLQSDQLPPIEKISIMPNFNPPPIPKLNPPPAPVLASNPQNEAPKGMSLRGTIIDELKQLFTKVKKQEY